MKRTLLHIAAGLAVIAALATGLQAQVNRVTGPGVLDYAGAAKVDNDGEVPTYSGSIVGVAPASSATDIGCLIGSATKTVKVNKVTISGTAGTLITVPVSVVKRASANTGGTPIASAIVAGKHQSTQSAATAVITGWTANPTIVDSAPGVLLAQTLTLPVTSAGTSSSSINLTYGGRGGSKAPILSGVAQVLCVNLNATSPSSGLVNVSFEWTEE